MKRYNLRFLLVAFLFVAVVLAVYANQEERKLVQWVEASGGSVQYAYSPHPNPKIKTKL